jgi:hypothetical protein
VTGAGLPRPQTTPTRTVAAVGAGVGDPTTTWVCHAPCVIDGSRFEAGSRFMVDVPRFLVDLAGLVADGTITGLVIEEAE